MLCKHKTEYADPEVATFVDGILEWKGESMTVVTVESQGVVLKSSSGKTIRFSTQPEVIDSHLAAELAQQELAGPDGAKEACLGTFWALDAKGDRKRARLPLEDGS